MSKVDRKLSRADEIKAQKELERINLKIQEEYFDIGEFFFLLSLQFTIIIFMMLFRDGWQKLNNNLDSYLILSNISLICIYKNKNVLALIVLLVFFITFLLSTQKYLSYT